MEGQVRRNCQVVSQRRQLPQMQLRPPATPSRGCSSAPDQGARMTPMTERRDANLFKVLIAQIRQNIKGNVILGKALRVLPETRLLKPVRNLLHRGPLRIQRYPFWTGTSTLAPARACCSPQRKGPHVLSGRLGHSTTPALCPGFLRKSKSVSDYALTPRMSLRFPLPLPDAIRANSGSFDTPRLKRSRSAAHPQCVQRASTRYCAMHRVRETAGGFPPK